MAKKKEPVLAGGLVANMKPGAVFSELSFYTFQKIEGGQVYCKNDTGQDLRLSADYVENLTSSANYYETIEEMTKTQLAELFIGSPRIALTVCFITDNKEKTLKAFNEEKAALIKSVTEARVSDVEGLLSDMIDNPLTRTISGKERVMIGRHYGSVNELGRVSFTDMEADRGDKEYDGRIRWVDPRTIQYLIINKVKYTLK